MDYYFCLLMPVVVMTWACIARYGIPSNCIIPASTTNCIANCDEKIT